eukprot:8522130-Lingulodinium_polyedra.AAC.1
MAQVAHGVDPELPPAARVRGDGPHEVYSDGACLDPEDPLMARAAWAARVPGEGGGTWAGPAQGPQTALRGEFIAAVVA